MKYTILRAFTPAVLAPVLCVGSIGSAQTAGAQMQGDSDSADSFLNT